MSSKLNEISGHAYAPGFEPSWWVLLTEGLALVGLSPMLAGLLLLGGALVTVTLRRSVGARRRSEFSALDHAMARAAQEAAQKQAELETLRELRIRRSMEARRDFA